MSSSEYTRPTIFRIKNTEHLRSGSKRRRLSYLHMSERRCDGNPLYTFRRHSNWVQQHRTPCRTECMLYKQQRQSINQSIDRSAVCTFTTL